VDLNDFKVLSFDCYGTLIDWEAGILSQIGPFLSGHGIDVEDAAILGAFGQAESMEEADDPGELYPEILRRVHSRLASNWGLDADTSRAEEFGNSVVLWPAFSDAHGALAELHQTYRLVILSNVDRASFAASERRLGVSFDAVYTAEDIGSYKPDPRNFDHLLDRERESGFERADILHVGQSVFHDHEPASAAGIATCWIQRPSPAGEHGAARPPDTKPNIEFHFSSLADLVVAVNA